MPQSCDDRTSKTDGLKAAEKTCSLKLEPMGIRLAMNKELQPAAEGMKREVAKR